MAFSPHLPVYKNRVETLHGIDLKPNRNIPIPLKGYFTHR